MFAGESNAARKIAKIIDHLTEKKTTITHGRHIALAEAKRIFGDKVIELEQDDELQDLILTVHHACIITLQATAAYKIIENHEGRAFVQQLHMQLVQAPVG